MANIAKKKTSNSAANGTPIELNEKAIEYVKELEDEKKRLNNDFPICEKLVDEELEKVYSTGRVISKEYFANVFREKPLRVSQKVYVPSREHPNFNFVGKLLGPKGNTLRRLQEETLCKMSILGRGSKRDPNLEEELRNLKDPRYNHLNKDLHVEISTVAPPTEAYARIAFALTEVRKYMIPDMNDQISQEQLREIKAFKDSRSFPNNKATDPQRVQSILEKTRNAIERGANSKPSYPQQQTQRSYNNAFSGEYYGHKAAPSGYGSQAPKRFAFGPEESYNQGAYNSGPTSRASFRPTPYPKYI